MRRTQPHTIKLGNSITGNPQQLSILKSHILQEKISVRALVVSAPGKSEYFPEGKVTDLLIQGKYDAVKQGFRRLADDLQVVIADDLWDAWFVYSMVHQSLPDYIQSCGEFITAQILRKLFCMELCLPNVHISIEKNGDFHAGNTFPSAPFVMPGFYGRSADDVNLLRVFPRGGTDISAAIVAAATGTTLFRFTDTPLRYADPRIIPDARVITSLHYDDLLALADIVKDVLHPIAVRHCKDCNVPIHIGTLNEVTVIDGNVAPDFTGVHSSTDLYVPSGMDRLVDVSLRTVALVGTGMVGKAGFLGRACKALESVSVASVWSPPHEGIIYFFVDTADREKAIRLLYDEFYAKL